YVIHTLSLHDALPIFPGDLDRALRRQRERRLRLRDAAAARALLHRRPAGGPVAGLRSLHHRRAVLAGPPARRHELLAAEPDADRSEEHTSELQSLAYL